MDSLCRVRNKIMYVLLWRTVYCATREINTKITLSWAPKQFAARVHTLFYITLWPGDVNKNFMNMYLYKCSHNLMIQMPTKFNDDIFASFSVIMKNIVSSFIKEYRGTILMPPCDVFNDVVITKNTFLCIIWDDVFISEVNWSCFGYFKIFKMAAILSLQQTFYWKLYGKFNIPERHYKFWAFYRRPSSNIDGDISI